MRTLGLLVLASALVSTAASAVSLEDASAPSGSMPTGNGPYWAPDNAVLWDNGPLITTAGNCPNNTNESQVRFGGVFGYTSSVAANIRLADNFTVPAGRRWLIDSVTFFGYQTGAGSVNPSISGTNYQIWNGAPDDAGSVVICGNTTTNQMALSVFSGTYRTDRIHPCPYGTDRAIWAELCTLPYHYPPCLFEGTYWVDFQLQGSESFPGPYVPPVTPRLGGPDGTPDARQSVAGAWAQIAGWDGQSEEIPFIIEGSPCSWTPVENSTWGQIKGQYR